MLEAQCKSWSGPLAAVVYEPTLALPEKASKTARHLSVGITAASSGSLNGSSGGSKASTNTVAVGQDEIQQLAAAAVVGASSSAEAPANTDAAPVGRALLLSKQHRTASDHQHRVLLRGRQQQQAAPQQKGDAQKAVQDMFDR
jgi:hypothetical protein